MFASAALVTLRILGFKSGPQDFPYDRQLMQLLPVFATLAGYLEYRFTLTPAVALAQSAGGVAALALFVWQLLRLRNLPSRFAQTYGALLATGIALTLLLLPCTALLAPTVQQLAGKPELLGQVDVPALPTLAAAAISVWNLAVSAHIFRGALGLGPGAAMLMAVMGAIFVTVFAALAGSLVV